MTSKPQYKPGVLPGRTPYLPMRHEQVKPTPADFVPPERFRWPKEAHLAPSHCGHCGRRLLRNEIPTAEDPIVDVTCLFCSRVACELVYGGLRWAVPR